MISSTGLSLLTLLSSSLALPTPNHTTLPIEATCGELNVFYTGFTAYHPYVLAQNFSLPEVDRGLRHGTASLVKAGFNVHVVFQGPEQPLSNLAERLEGNHWDFTAIGFGIRGFRNGTATTRFEDLTYLFNEVVPSAPTVYNWGPDSFAEAITRHVTLTEDCGDKPGKLLGYEEICDPSVCEKVMNVLDGDLGKLTYDE